VKLFRLTTWCLCLTTCGLFAGMMVFSGCARPHKVQVSQQGRLMFQELELTCQFARENNADSFYPVEQVSGTESGSAPNPADWNRAQFELIYPIPESIQKSLKKNRDGAIVRVEYWKEFQSPTVRTLSERGWNAFPIRANKKQADQRKKKKEKRYVKEAVIPRYLLDFLLEDLNHSGFFENQERPSGEAEIMVRIDEGTVTKNWDLEPRMREMIARVLMTKIPQSADKAGRVTIDLSSETVTK